MSNFLEKAGVRDRFSIIYQATHKIKNEELANSLFELEKFNFMKLLEENPSLNKANEVNKYATFIDVIKDGLSFDKTQKHVYLMVRNVKTNQKDEKGKDIYSPRMSYEISKNGVMFLVKKAGSVKDISEPVIVYEGDDIDVKTINGDLQIIHSPAIPRKSKKILGCYFFVITNDNRKDPVWYPIGKIERLKKFSEKQNKGESNVLYTSGYEGQIDEGFFVTKAVKAGLAKYSIKPTGLNHVEDGVYVDENTNVLSDAELADKYMNDIPNDDVESTNDFTDFDEIPSEAF